MLDSDEDAEDFDCSYENFQTHEKNLIEYDNGLTKIKNVVFHKYDLPAAATTAATVTATTTTTPMLAITTTNNNNNEQHSLKADQSENENDYLKMKLNKLLLLNNTTSAYDTCSQMSSNDRSTTSSSASKNGEYPNSSSSTSGNTSGDYNQFSIENEAMMMASNSLSEVNQAFAQGNFFANTN